jgi:hypothetical protein
MGEIRLAARKPLVAWSLTGSALVVLAAALLLLGLNASRPNASRLNAGLIGFYGLLSVGAVAYAGAGGLIARRVPGNAIGWLLSLAGLTLTVAMLSEQYALYGLATNPGAVPAAKIAGVLSGAAVEVTVILLSVLVLLFPDGRLPSRRWRPLLWATVVVVAGWITESFQAGTTITGGLTNALQSAGVSYRNPYGLLPRNGWYSDLLRMIFVLGLVVGVLVVASVFARRRGASTELRKQLAWLGYVGLMTAVSAAALAVASVAAPGAANAWLGQLIWGFLVLTPVAGIPVACAVAVLKYRLYEIDKIISRTLAYAIVTGLLVGVYAGLVLLATEVLTIKSPVAVAVATLAAAALFTPLRSRVQHLVDRKFNRTRYDADQTLTAFAARLKDAVDQDAVRADLLGVVHRSLEPTHAAVWLQRNGSSG